jgi:putative protease
MNAYYEENDGYPALEMIVYGKAPLMFTKYCPLKKMNQCGVCKTKRYELKDEHGTFPIITHEDCTTTILNGKTLNLLDELQSIKGIEAFRLNFTVESKEQVENTINDALNKLNGGVDQAVFNQETDTRGHFYKEIL